MLRSLIFLLFLSSSLCAQRLRDHYVYSELAGTGGIYSMGWEGFTKKNYGIQVGLTAIPADGELIITLPALLKYTHGKQPHHPEFGIGLGTSVVNRGQLQAFIRGIGMLGWRYEKAESRWCYRAFYSPLFSFLVDFQWQHWGGLGISYRLTP